MYKSILSVLILFLVFMTEVKAQEFICNVEVNTQQVQGTDKKVYESLKNAIYEFMNNRSWTSYKYKMGERIECSMLISITERMGTDEFKATLSLALRRPVFNSSYTSILFNYIDKDFQFKYVEFQPLDFYENTYTSELTSVLAFYAYVFIGLDFDSFTLNGGAPFFQIAQNIVNSAQNSNVRGWKSFDGLQNRYWLAENLTNPSYEPLHKFLYEYHRRGLDLMYDNPDVGRANILSSLKYLQEVKKVRPGLFLLQLLVDAKREELVNIFSEGTSIEKTAAFNILKEVDPANTSTYQKITQK